MGRSKGFDANAAVSFDIGGDSGGQVGGANGFLQVELPLVVSVFFILNRIPGQLLQTC
jgi:hypothetical protein